MPNSNFRIGVLDNLLVLWAVFVLTYRPIGGSLERWSLHLYYLEDR